jgi:hypothetical protein
MHAVLGVRQYCKVHMKIWFIQFGLIFIFLRILEVHKSETNYKEIFFKKKCIGPDLNQTQADPPGLSPSRP